MAEAEVDGQIAPRGELSWSGSI